MIVLDFSLVMVNANVAAVALFGTVGSSETLRVYGVPAENASLFEFSRYLSRACLGKMIGFYI
jgi:hypothetical protein